MRFVEKVETRRESLGSRPWYGVAWLEVYGQCVAVLPRGSRRGERAGQAGGVIRDIRSNGYTEQSVEGGFIVYVAGCHDVSEVQCHGVVCQLAIGGRDGVEEVAELGESGMIGVGGSLKGYRSSEKLCF